jgi:hypothetical protein
MRSDLAQVFTEQVDIQCTTDDALRLKPLRLVNPMGVTRGQLVRPTGARPHRHAQNLLDMIEEIVPIPVELEEQGEQRMPVGGQPLLKICPFPLICLVFGPQGFQSGTQAAQR